MKMFAHAAVIAACVLVCSGAARGAEPAAGPFPVAAVHLEQNATDGDMEVVFEVKGGPAGLACGKRGCAATGYREDNRPNTVKITGQYREDNRPKIPHPLENTVLPYPATLYNEDPYNQEGPEFSIFGDKKDIAPSIHRILSEHFAHEKVKGWKYCLFQRLRTPFRCQHCNMPEPHIMQES